MELFLELKNISSLSRREIDELVENAAASGYRGLVLPRINDWDSLRSFCHSAHRHSAELWLRDDPGSPSGDFGGEISSVPSLSPKRLTLTDKSGDCKPIWEGDGLAAALIPGGGLWGGDPFSAEAAEAFLDCSYIELRRELRRFLGYELTGVVTAYGEALLPWSEKLITYISVQDGADAPSIYKSLFSANSSEARESYAARAGELFAETTLRPLSEFCRQWGLEPVAETDFPIPAAEKYFSHDTAFTDMSGLSMGERLCGLFKLFASGKSRAAITAGLYPPAMEKLWCARAQALNRLLPSPKAAKLPLPQGLEVFCSGNMTLVCNPSEAAVSWELEPESLGARYIADLDGSLYLPLSKKLLSTLHSGGCLILVSDGDREAEPLPPYLSCGAVFGELETYRELIPEFAGWEDNRLPLELRDGSCEFEVSYIGENTGISVEAPGADYVRLNGHELTESNIGDPGGPMAVGKGVFRLGRNVIETDGSAVELRGSFSTDGESLIDPVRPGAGNVREQGLARYDGPLHYEVTLPDGCGGKYLILEGGFGCAAIRIGRRKQPLLTPPFMMPLFSFDDGKTAEIIIYPSNDRKDVPFGLDKVNIADVKNPSI